jgi:hypothetical protein
MGDREGALAAVANARIGEAMPVQLDHLAELGIEPSARVMEIRRGRPGRPAGARNRRSEDVARHVIESLGDPLVRQVAIATAPLGELAAALGCTLMDAAVEQRLAAAVVLPYLHRRQPLAVDVTDHRMVTLTIVRGEGGRGEAARSDVVQVLDIAQTEAEGKGHV